MNKLILIMIDGISSDQFSAIRQHLPHLDHLAKQGSYIKALTPEKCGTSFPGRTSMIVGRPATEHGIYGNRIWDGEVFRWSNPYDVRTETIASLSKEQGAHVINAGFGMVRPEDCHLYISPWWVDDVLSETASGAPHPQNANWKMSDKNLDPHSQLKAAGIDINKRVNPAHDNHNKLPLGILADYQLMEMAADLIESESPPDLIMLEVAITDYFLHLYGTEHPVTQMSLRTADAQVGMLIERLRNANKLQDYNFAIMSDHGHHLMQETVHPDVLLPQGTRWSSEGSMLFVAPRSDSEAQEVSQRLLNEGMQLWPENLLPRDRTDQLLTFCCPEGEYISFEKDLQASGKIRGTSKYQSNHGMRPGTAQDNRFAIFSGPNVPTQQIEFAEAIQVAPTIASILGVQTPWRAQPMFNPL